MSLAQSKIQKQYERLLSRQLDDAEVELILEVRKAETLIRGRLGLAESLVRRGWLTREGNLVRLSDDTRKLLDEVQ